MKMNRMIGIITILLEHEKVTAPKLAEIFEVSRRTINRDIEEILMAGIPIITLQGFDGGIGIDPNYKLDKTLFTKEEMQSILIGLKGIDSVSHSTYYQQLMNKLSMKDTSISLVNDPIIIDLSSHYKDTLSIKIEILKAAIQNKHTVNFDYYNINGNKNYDVEPYLIRFQWSSWYLIAYSIEKSDFRTYKLNRLWNLTKNNQPYLSRELPKEVFNPNLHFTKKIHLKAIFDKSSAFRLIEEYGIECFTETDDQRLYFEMDFTNQTYMMNWLLSFGDQVEIIEPESIKVIILKQIENILNKYKQT